MRKKQLRIALSSNEGYISKLGPCLSMLEKNANPEIKLDFISVGFDGSEFIKQYPRFNHLHMEVDQVRCLNMHCSPQYGDFLFAYGNADLESTWDDVIIFIDGDVLLQRPFTQKELDHFLSYTDDMFGVNYNEGPNDNIWNEALRLQIRQPESVFRGRWWPDGSIPACYNTGVSIATTQGWKTMLNIFKDLWEEEKNYLWYPSAQWLMSYIIKNHLKLDLLSLDIHAHGHFGFHEGVYTEGEETYYNGNMCLFRHKINWNP